MQTVVAQVQVEREEKRPDRVAGEGMGPPVVWGHGGWDGAVTTDKGGQTCNMQVVTCNDSQGKLSSGPPRAPLAPS